MVDANIEMDQPNLDGVQYERSMNRKWPNNQCLDGEKKEAGRESGRVGG